MCSKRQPLPCPEPAGRGGWGRPSPPALGASAAVNALMVVDVLLYPARTVLLYGIVPMPMALLGALWLYADVTGAVGVRALALPAAQEWHSVRLHDR